MKKIAKKIFNHSNKFFKLTKKILTLIISLKRNTHKKLTFKNNKFSSK